MTEPQRFTVRHVSVYRYSEPVSFGEHRMMLFPRASHDLRLVTNRLVITPTPTRLHWLHDVFDNSVAIATFAGEASELRFDSEVTLEHFEAPMPDYALEPYAVNWPFSYTNEEACDLVNARSRRHPDPEVDEWARRFVPIPGVVRSSEKKAGNAGDKAADKRARKAEDQPDDQPDDKPADRQGDSSTMALLRAMTLEIKSTFSYVRRTEKGVNRPGDTLRSRSGSCRDFAVLMMDAVRSLGLAARFVSGYLFVPEHDATQGGGATHAWLQIYLPGAGWVDFDPTNSIVGNRHLIRVAVAWNYDQALPLWGTWHGAPHSFRGLQVDVSVTEGK
ncbi:transglutaminase family protein [Paraburkholderia sp. PREW-6R]|uniref:transglutaminase family protein n=1 Tax=Paraburkholderia sp. PREW-6R TaxID=3141544 RepID=UPI0031F4FECD